MANGISVGASYHPPKDYPIPCDLEALQQRDTQVVLAMERLDKRACQIAEQVQELYRRCAPILRPSEPSVDGAGGNSREPGLCDMAQKISRIMTELEHASFCLDDIFSRWEL